MESLSRPFQSKKLSNATTKHPYDGVFSGNRHKYAAGATSIDYREIFGNSHSASSSSSSSSSIPVLDLSTLGERSPNMMLNSKPDYPNIFGSRDHDDVDCYQQLFASNKFRPPSSTTTTTSHDSDVFSRRSSDELTQFNMSYNKISQQSKRGLNGTKHVTQLHPTPGFSRVIDDHVSPPKMKPEKLKSSPVHVNDDSSNKNEFVSEDKNVRTFVSSPSASTINVVKHKRFESRELKTFPVSFDEELDVNSAASALKKAIEKAQESIRIAKESVGRKKKGLENFSSKNSKGSKVKNKMDDVTGATSPNVFPDFVTGDKLSVAKKVIEEMNGKFLDGSNSTRVTGETESKLLYSGGSFEYATSSSEAVHTEKVRTEPVEFEHEAQTINMVVDDYEGKIEVTKTASGAQESVERVEVEMFRESEENTDEIRLSSAQESVENLRNFIVSEKVENQKNVSQESNQCDNKTRLKSLENEKQEDVENAENPESYKQIEDVFNCSESENESEDAYKTEIHEEETVEMFNDVSELETKACVKTFDNGIEETKESAQVYDYSFEETETTIHEACKADINDKYVETTREVSDITETTEGSFASEVDKLYVFDNEDKYESKSEENDEQSESSFGNIDGVKIEDDQSNKEDDIIDTLVDLGSENDLQSESSSSSTKTLEEESTTQPPQNEKPDTIKDSKMFGKEHFRRIHEETARERENEKNRIAVNRAIREARERAFIEARERAEFERAAVEKATEEVRQRLMAEVREKVAKASAATKLSSERTSAQSKLRAERAAVERATSEARQRALEKAMSQKSVSDLNSSESALRSKMKLEKDNRIMERAARALAEKEKRDLLAQKEQAERNRLAENLDADIKKWSNGKEGNLRALLSTLQYILGPESGWKPVSLAEIITSSAVKKAYRKATLCVHPDKLQQRGATIQHKYICEKVFDLLKAAWNKFNSKEK